MSKKKGFKDQDLLFLEHSISLSYPNIESLKSMVNCNNIDGLQSQSTLMAAAMEFSCKSWRWCRKLEVEMISCEVDEGRQNHP
jgi:hypothetical protein